MRFAKSFLVACASSLALAVPALTAVVPAYVPEQAKAAVTGSINLEGRDISGFYNSLSFDVVSFYEDFVSNRYSYLASYKSFFLTHTFAAGSLSSEFSALVTYTDDSFTTILSASPSLKTAFATLATEFPWYSAWVKNNAASGTATATASSNAGERSVPLPATRGDMNTIVYAMMAVFLTTCLTIF